MILVLLGTFPIQFKRPLVELDRLCKEGLLNEEIIVQSGHTEVDSNYLTVKPFMSADDLLGLYKKARLIITHAGSGSILKAVKLGKKVIAIPRLAKYGEHVDDHQLEILREFERLGYLIAWREEDSLIDLLNRVEDFEPAPYVSQKQQIIDFLEDYISQL
ncbi:UDP-N-acetylglucosamine transferase subunit ALG13 [Cyclobacterium xiamenense]|uniref:UDP-N-acetylglucosamine transferase subunit ALG13 n=1 Tax=Cyclobacterium xiamenense TaxID=1297121 RepID=A0A1H7AUJ4_9BACT|nr:PssE/Cps14G family polysaccharide biosynthesis glycosyltransferase [Cyclobacterium xiamenense]SEJ68968.1 UDP-N-acetylglucosamine transferase subunit ALG13 [Cyclobacterium xiamenense]